MNYAGRMNSFIFKGNDVFDTIAAYRGMKGITHMEFNYTEHIEGYNIEEMRRAMGLLKVNGFAVRWRNLWKNGDFTNPDPELRQKAIDMRSRKAGDTGEYRRL